jgi:trk system potassium uptake protein TrkA
MARQQMLIVGLGQFGMSLARTLSGKGVEIIVCDRRKVLVEEASSFVTEAVTIDATDEAELAQLQPRRRDCSICAIGDDSRESSIVCTALLRQMGAPWIVSRANNPMHRRILQLVGAHLVVNPEEEFGRRFSNRLMFRNIVADMPLDGDLHLAELTLPAFMEGKNLVELELPRRFDVMVVAIRRGEQAQVLRPTPTTPLEKGDRLLVVSSEAAIAKLAGA